MQVSRVEIFIFEDVVNSKFISEARQQNFHDILNFGSHCPYNLVANRVEKGYTAFDIYQ